MSSGRHSGLNQNSGPIVPVLIAGNRIYKLSSGSGTTGTRTSGYSCSLVLPFVLCVESTQYLWHLDQKKMETKNSNICWSRCHGDGFGKH